MPETARPAEAPEPIPSPPPTAEPDVSPPVPDVDSAAEFEAVPAAPAAPEFEAVPAAEVTPDMSASPEPDAPSPEPIPEPAAAESVSDVEPTPPTAAEPDAPAGSADDTALDDILGTAGTLDQEPIADEPAPTVSADAAPEADRIEPGPPAETSGEDATGAGDATHGFPPPPSVLADDLPEEAGRPPRRSAGLAKVASLVVLVLLLMGIGVGGFFMQSKIVMWFPASSKIYAMVGLKPNVLGQGLQIVEPKPTKQIDGNDEILMVKGQISNTTSKQITVPLMRAALLDKFGKVLNVWTFNAAKQEISPGESADYATQFRNPPAAAERLDITFTRPGEGGSPVKPQVTPASSEKPPAN